MVFGAIARDVRHVALFCSTVTLFKSHAFDVTMTAGPSMLPTLSISGELLLLDRRSSRLDRLTVGDVVTARNPRDPDKIVCKRVIAMV